MVAWKINPHPLLTQALLQCIDSKDAKAKAIRLSQKLARIHPESPETRFLLASVALKEGKADIARNEAKLLIEDHESVRSCALMAEAESIAGDAAQSAYWLKRSQSALPDSGYACTQCRKPAANWHLTCQHCGSVGSVAWQ